MNLNLKWSKFMTLFTEVLEDEKEGQEGNKEIANT